MLSRYRFTRFFTPHSLPQGNFLRGILGYQHWLAAIIMAVSLAACGKEPLIQKQGFVFGTLVEVSIWGEGEQRAAALAGEVLQEFDRLQAMLHAWKPSELSRLNSAISAGQQKVAVSPELATILADAARLSTQSDGRFNPAIGNLVRLWGFQADEFKPLHPPLAAIQKLVAAKPVMANLIIEHGAVTSQNPAVSIDLGGYAKGYALDQAAALLRARGVNNALVNVGGNIIALGKHGKRPWRVGIQHPRKPGPIATVDLHDGEAIGTSGDYQRYFELDGKRYCHLIDPRTGVPVQGVQAVTVIAAPGTRAGTLSDVASKPLFVAGRKGWRAAAQQMGIGAAMLIDERGAVFVTQQLNQRATFTEGMAKAVVVP